MKKTQEVQFQERYDQLTRRAKAAADARNRLEDFIERIRNRDDWQEFCESKGINPDASFEDFMA